MTFDQLYEAVKALVFPEDEADNLIDRHRAWVQDAMVDLQRHVVCLQENNCTVVRQNESKVRCGATILDPVEGEIQRVQTYMADGACAVREFVEITDRDMDRVSRNYTQCIAQDDDPATTGTLEDLPPCDPSDSPAATLTDVPDTRGPIGWWSKNDKAIRLYPLLYTDEWAFIFWRGLKSQYEGSDVVASAFENRTTQRAIEHYLEAQVYRFEQRDMAAYKVALGEYQEARKHLIIDCRRRTIVPASPFDAMYLVQSGGCGCCGSSVPGPSGDTIDYQVFDTVAEMLASDTTRWRTARCANYLAGDQTITIWIRDDGTNLLPNGTDILQADDDGILMRIYVREGPSDGIAMPNPPASTYTVGQPICTPTIDDLRDSTYNVLLVIVISDANGQFAMFTRSSDAGTDDGQNTIVNAVGVTYVRKT